METADSPITRATVYIETSIVNYLTARPSRDLLVAAHQQLTVTWWEQQRAHYASSPRRSCWLRHARVIQMLLRARRRVRTPPALGRHGCSHYACGGARQWAGTPRTSGPRCAPYRRGLRPRDGVSSYVELCASGQCPVRGLYRTHLSQRGLHPTDYLYPRRT